MKNLLSRISACVLTLILVFSLTPAMVNAANVGDVIGHAQPTDIVATINGYQLESYNVSDYTYICVEDLRYYGFDVVYDDATRTLSVSRYSNITLIDPQNTNPNFWLIGSSNTYKDILYTDIVTYFNGKYVESYNINGQTIVNFNDLAMFGTVAYDNDRREISLHLDQMNVNPVSEYALLLHKENLPSPYWKIIYRAKGSVLMLIATALPSTSADDISLFVNNVLPEDKAEAQSTLALLRENNIPVNSIYVEYKNTDGSLITAYQVN